MVKIVNNHPVGHDLQIGSSEIIQKRAKKIKTGQCAVACGQCLQQQIQWHWKWMGSPSCMAVAGGTGATQGDARRVTDMSNVPNNTHCDGKKK